MDYLEKEVDPAGNPVNYMRSDYGLEAWSLFCVMVAGKGANQTKAALNRFLDGVSISPFAYIRHLQASDSLTEKLISCRCGQYEKLTKAFSQLASHDTNWLRTCSVSELEELHGVGMKTSRFFILSSRQNAPYAALDTHLLKELREETSLPFLATYNLDAVKIPAATPSKSLYLKLERVILDMAQHHKLTPAEYDYKVWYKYYSGS